MSVATNQRNSDAIETRRFLDVNEAVAYLHQLGLVTATKETIKHYAYYTDKLPRPKVVGRRAYWKRTDLDLLVEKL